MFVIFQSHERSVSCYPALTSTSNGSGSPKLVTKKGTSHETLNQKPIGGPNNSFGNRAVTKEKQTKVDDILNLSTPKRKGTSKATPNKMGTPKQMLKKESPKQRQKGQTPKQAPKKITHQAPTKILGRNLNDKKVDQHSKPNTSCSEVPMDSNSGVHSFDTKLLTPELIEEMVSNWDFDDDISDTTDSNHNLQWSSVTTNNTPLKTPSNYSCKPTLRLFESKRQVPVSKKRKEFTPVKVPEGVNSPARKSQRRITPKKTFTVKDIYVDKRATLDSNQNKVKSAGLKVVDTNVLLSSSTDKNSGFKIPEPVSVSKLGSNKRLSFVTSTPVNDKPVSKHFVNNSKNCSPIVNPQGAKVKLASTKNGQTSNMNPSTDNTLTFKTPLPAMQCNSSKSFNNSTAFKTSSSTPYSSDRSSFLNNQTSSMKTTPPLCQCGRRSKRRMVQTPGQNMGRFFFSCGVRKGADSKDGCKFFKWETQSMSSRSDGSRSASSCNGSSFNGSSVKSSNGSSFNGYCVCSSNGSRYNGSGSKQLTLAARNGVLINSGALCVTEGQRRSLGMRPNSSTNIRPYWR